MDALTLDGLLRTLRAHGVTKYRLGDLEIELAELRQPMVSDAPKALEEITAKEPAFATSWADLMTDDGKGEYIVPDPAEQVAD